MSLADRMEELYGQVIPWVRQYQERFPPEDDGLDWSDVTTLLKPQTDFYLQREGKFNIRVRPDLVVGVGHTLMAVDFTTAKDPAYVSEARFALNHHALIRARDRCPEWQRFQTVATRVELLALGYGFTVWLSPEQAEHWHQRIVGVAEALAASQYQPNPGEYCQVCPWLVPCQLGGELVGGQAF
jgi:hypothetical protein